MSKAIPKLAAMVAAGCLIGTMALPANAASTPDSPVQSENPHLQNLDSHTVATAEVARDGYSVTAAPKIEPVAVVVAPPASSATASPPVPGPVNASAPTQAYSGAAVLDYASQFVGAVPYGMGNTPTTSFSCDGFTQYVFSNFGISLPRTANAQAALGSQISQADAVAGDLVWWPGQHIGIYDGAGGMYDSPNWGRFVQHAPLWGSPTFVRLK